jgi:cation transport protein ChaC
MTVTRADLEADRVRQYVRRTPLAPLLLSETELDASLQATLEAVPAGEDLWLFGYGSLVWNPMIRFQERRPATLYGYHRGFYLLSRINRGTPRQPGLVLALDRGGCCRGVAYRIARAEAESELRVLWRREMLLGSYQPRLVPLRAREQAVRGLAFVVNRAGSGYVGRLSEEETVQRLLKARGYYGSGAEYLLRTAEGLLESGIRDRQLLRLRELVRQRLG